MRFRTALSIALCAAAVGVTARVTFGGDPPPTARGDSVRNFVLEDLDGKKVALADLRDAKAVVLAWTAPGCPIAKLYAPRLAALSAEWAPRGVRFLGVGSDDAVDVEALRAQVRAGGIAFPVLLDRDGALAARLGVSTTTTVVLLDANRRVRYRGALDDQYDVGGRKAEPTKRWLVDAIEAVLSSRAVAITDTPAPGCAITLALRAAPRAEGTPPTTWADGIGALVHARCSACHRPGQAGPFSLLAYEDVRRRAAVVKDVVSTGRMPPFHADVPRGIVANDPRLADDEKARLLAWIEAGAPQGDPAKAPPPPASGDAAAWEIGKPDAVYAFEKAQAIPAEGVVPYRFIDVKTDQPEDRWVEALEVHPGDPAAVHHVLVAIAPEGSKKRRGLFDPLSGFFAAMVPGGRSQVFPAGMAKRLPKGATLVFQMHYTPYGIASEDRTQIAFRFLPAGREPEREVHTAGVFNPRFAIPPGAKDFEVAGTLPVPFDARILTFMPHMHLRGAAFRYEIVRFDEKPRTIFSVPRYDFNWQRPYRLVEPMPVRKGSFLRGVGTFDNSAGNPYNPDPTVEVRWGDQTWDEMMIGYVDYVRDPESTPPPK